MSFFLDTKDQSIVAVLASPPATTQPTFSSSYKEYGLKGDVRKEQGFVKLTRVQGELTGTTERTVVAAPDGGTQFAFELIHLSIYNCDTAPISLSLIHKDLNASPNDHVLWSGALEVGESVVQNNIGMYQVYGSNGIVKLVTA